PTSQAPSDCISPAIRPAKPLRTPQTSQPRTSPLRTTAQIAAFIPKASPPLVKTAIRFISRVHSIVYRAQRRGPAEESTPSFYRAQRCGSAEESTPSFIGRKFVVLPPATPVSWGPVRARIG